MKKKVLLIIILLLFSFGCEKEETKKEGENEVKVKQDLTIIEQDSNGEITKGTLEGYTFVETDTPTDRIKIQMTDGRVILAVLSNSDSPITIANFKSLVQEHYYDGLIFHRVIKDFMIQTGDPTGTGTGGSAKNIKGEFAKNGVTNNLAHTRGVLSMARRGGNPDTEETMNSASSQFFIVQKDYPSLDGSYASFGKVFAGMDAVDSIATVSTDAYDKPYNEQKMLSIRFINIEK